MKVLITVLLVAATFSLSGRPPPLTQPKSKVVTLKATPKVAPTEEKPRSLYWIIPLLNSYDKK